MDVRIQEIVDYLHKGIECAAMNIVGGSIDLDRTAAGRQQPVSLFPGGFIQCRSEGGVGPDQECRSGDTGEQGQQFARLTGIGEDAGYRLTTHFVQRIDLALDIFFGPTRIAGRNVDAQFFVRATNIAGIIGNSLLNTARAKVMSWVFEDQARNGRHGSVKTGSTCQYDCCRPTPGMPDQGRTFQSQSCYERGSIIGRMPQAIGSRWRFDTLTVPSHIQSIHTVTGRQRRANTDPALCRARDTVEQEDTGQVR